MKFISHKIVMANDAPPSEPATPTPPEHPPEFMNVLHDIRKQGGRPLLVGGFVRDQFFGKEPKDRDVEVYHLPPDQLENVLGKHGQVNSVGKSFGVLKMRSPHGEEYDFSTPRRDSKVGDGHKGFLAQPDPNMTEQEAFGRRDFTMNAIGQDPFTGQYIDHYDGIGHIKNKQLVATTDAYKEDPLRVLRGAQMAARFGLDMDDRTAKMSKEIHDTYPSLSKERVWEEWQKLANKGDVPSKGLNVLDKTGWISHMPHLDNDPARAQAVDNIANIAKDNPNRSAMFYATLMHDKSPEQVGEFLKEIGATNDITAKTMKLASNARAPFDASPASVRNMSAKLNGVSLDDYLKVQQAINPKNAKMIGQVRNMAQQLGVLQSAPKAFISGKDLLDMGYKQGPELGKKLQELYQAQLDGKITSKEQGLQALQGRV